MASYKIQDMKLCQNERGLSLIWVKKHETPGSISTHAYL